MSDEATMKTPLAAADAPATTEAPATAEAPAAATEQTEAVPAEIVPKHPLQHKWVLWYDNPKKKLATETWEENLKKIYTFDTVEDFWCLFNNVLPPTKLSTGSNYHLFKEGIRPMWEDPINMKGGKWILTNTRQRRARLDDSWMHVMLALIGEALEDDDDVCGCVVSVRKSQDRLAVWTKTAVNEPLQRAVGRNFRKVLDLGKNEVLKFQSHADAAASGSSFQNEVLYDA
ncbi:eukaryotic initiation factor 4E [Achlya hypogyna]|uniref:mRNA cap-binding protein n=1 Tax=Achlya hypogyna TaxID=1202772 RepID=A0A1V9YGZ3_ACHHY|nr:eukaryotic initiation factor 4E [Achlya hypogyna]